MNHLIIYASLLFFFVGSIASDAQNQEDRGAEVFHDFTEKQYQGLLDKINSIHGKGPRTYYQKQLADLGFGDMSGVLPLMIVVHHNDVDVITAYSNGKFTRLNFSRLTGAWSAASTVWTISLIDADTDKPKKLWSTNRGMTFSEISRDQLYLKYLKQTAEQD
ncbi:hypothetical protein V2O64_21705 [Verrucomicrobiaceae bacterium 227]